MCRGAEETYPLVLLAKGLQYGQKYGIEENEITSRMKENIILTLHGIYHGIKLVIVPLLVKGLILYQGRF